MAIRLNVRSSGFPEIDWKIISAHCSGAPAAETKTASFVQKTEEARLERFFRARQPADRHDTRVMCAVTVEGPRKSSVSVMVRGGRLHARPRRENKANFLFVLRRAAWISVPCSCVIPSGFIQ